MLESNAPKELILHVVRAVGRADLAKGFENNTKSELPALMERIDSLKELMADMGKGQRLRFTYKPGAGAQVDVESAVKGTIEGDDSARARLYLAGSSPAERRPEDRAARRPMRMSLSRRKTASRNQRRDPCVPIV